MPLRATVTYVAASGQDFHIKSQSFDNPFFNPTVTLSDVVGVAFARAEGDSFTFTDVTLVDISKSILSDSFGFSDSFVSATDYRRSIPDSFTMLESVSRAFGLTHSTDSVSMGELLGRSFNRVDTDNFTFSDVLAAFVSKIVPDSFSFSDSINVDLEKQVNIIDQFSFSDTQSYTFSKATPDSFSFSDGINIEKSFILTDGFTLDDTAAVGKEKIKVKENIFGFSDTISITTVHGRALGNMVLGSEQFN